LTDQELRLVCSILSIVIIVKLLYYMQLMDNVAPLVNIIILIFGDIGWFLLVFVITMWGFATSFYMIG